MNKVIQCLVALLFQFVTITCYSQAIVRKIIEYNSFDKKERYEFPNIIVPHKPTTSKNINTDLRIAVLEIDTLKVQKSIFENVWASKESPMGVLHDLRFQIKYNSVNFISIAIMAEGCGAYCEDWTQYYNYDLKTGNKISLQSLFNSYGIKLILDSLNDRRKLLLQKQITKARLSIKNGSASEEDINREKEIIELYTTCIKENSINTAEYLSFYISNSILVFVPERCSAHVNRAIDELGNPEYIFKLVLWKKYLTPYALTLIKK